MCIGEESEAWNCTFDSSRWTCASMGEVNGENWLCKNVHNITTGRLIPEATSCKPRKDETRVTSTISTKPQTSTSSQAASTSTTTTLSPSPESSGMSTGWAIVMSLAVLGLAAGCAWAILPGILNIKVGGSSAPISQYTFV